MESADQMPKHNLRNVGKNVEVVAVPAPPVSEVSFIKLRLLIDSTVKVTGVYSGRNYTFSGAGSVQDVEETDVEWLLKRRQGGRQCCGGGETGNVVFELAGE